jgi:hypothetical protein
VPRGLMKVCEFVKVLEDEWDVGMYRKIMVIPATKSVMRKKQPFGEKSDMSVAEIKKSRSHDKSYWDKIGPTLLQKAEKNYSIYVKHMTDLYVVDFDTKVFKTTDLYDLLMAQNIYHCETAKGYHFYLRIGGLGTYKNEVNLANLDFFDKVDDIDLIARKRNVWEINTREINGSTFGPIEWQAISKYFNEHAMNFDMPQEGIVVEAVDMANDNQPEDMAEVGDGPLISDYPVCDMATMKMYLDRLSQRRVDNYEDWFRVSMIIYRNFRENPIDGYQLYDEWSSKSESYNKKSNRDKWDTFGNGTFTGKPLSYKSLRAWANDDDPQNEYEALYKSRGEEAMVRHMNQSIVYKRDSSEFIMVHSEEALDFYIKDKNKLSLDFENKTWWGTIDGKNKELNPINIWRKSKFRKEVSRIDFDPSSKRGDIYNLWTGYYVKKDECQDTGKSENLLKHIKTIWCNDDEMLYEYVLNWFAWVIQRPEQKVGVMMALKSKQGAGKGIVLGIIEAIMDGTRKNGYFSQVSNVESILGNYTYGIEGKCLVDFDEAYWGGNKKLEGQVKNLITENNQEIRKKFCAPYWIHNTTAFILTTNNDLFSGMSEDDRRHLCLAVNDVPVLKMTTDEKMDYFNSLSHSVYGQPPHPEVVSSLAHILYYRDIEEFNPRKYPKTALAQNQIQQGWSATTRFWFQVLDDEKWCDIGDLTQVGDTDWIAYGDIPPSGGLKMKDGTIGIDKEFIFTCYLNKKLGGYSNSKQTKEQFFKKTIEIFGSTYREVRHRIADRRMKLIICPPIDEWKEALQKHQGYYGDDFWSVVEDLDEDEIGDNQGNPPQEYGWLNH